VTVANPDLLDQKCGGISEERRRQGGASEPLPLPRDSTSRLTSLDAFRGLTVAGMILVNSPGSWDYVYPPLRHAEWHGLTPTDLVFPFFLFIVGVSLCLSLVGGLERGASRTELFRKALRRGLIIMAIGFVLQGIPHFDWASWRVPGVLQRIGLVYFCAAAVVLTQSIRRQIAILAALLLGYWALMVFLPGDLSPEGNFGAHLDRAVFGTHLWKKTWDPEGLLGTLPATATALLGALTGHWLRSGRERRELCGWMFVAGFGLMLAGVVLHPLFPINKSLWTSSFVLFTAGAAIELFSICFWLIDVEVVRRWARPFLPFGMNPLFIYAGAFFMEEILSIEFAGAEGTRTGQSWIYERLFVPWAGTYNGSLAFAIAHVLFWYVIAELLYRKRIFVKV
jgi:predicted acyltransferase